MTIDRNNYDSIAAEFAAMRISFVTEKKYLDFVVKLLPANAQILDLGCGSGLPIASYLIEKGFQVTGVDASKELLKIAKKNCPTMKLVEGDVRTVSLEKKYDAIIEWWCLFHLPKEDHGKMIARFAQWLKKGGIVEFTTGDSEHQSNSSAMFGHELFFYSLEPAIYEKYLKRYQFKILLRENHQDQQLVWAARYEG